MMDRQRPSASEDSRIPEAWIGQEVMLETTEALSSDLRAAAPVYLEDVNERGVVMLVTRHRDQSKVSPTSIPGVLWAGYAWRRMTSGRSRKLRAPPRQLAIRPRSWNACSELDAAMQERLADVLETRGADPQQQAMRYAFLANIAFPENAHILEVGCGTGVLTRALARRPEIDAVAGVDVAPPLLNKPANWPQTYPTLPFRRPTLGPCPSRIKLSISSSSTRL